MVFIIFPSINTLLCETGMNQITKFCHLSFKNYNRLRKLVSSIELNIQLLIFLYLTVWYNKVELNAFGLKSLVKLTCTSPLAMELL